MDLRATSIRFLPWVGVLILGLGIASTRTSPDVSPVLIAWGITAFFASIALAALTGAIERSVEAKTLLGLSLILLIGGSAVVSTGLDTHLLGSSSLTASLFGWIGFICFVLGFGALILAFLLPRPGDEKDDYGGLLPAHQSIYGIPENPAETLILKYARGSVRLGASE